MTSRLFSLIAGWKAKLIAAGVLLAVFGAALLQAYLKGKQSVRSSIERKNLKAMRQRKEIEDDVSAMDHADIDERFSEYMRDDR